MANHDELRTMIIDAKNDANNDIEELNTGRIHWRNTLLDGVYANNQYMRQYIGELYRQYKRAIMCMDFFIHQCEDLITEMEAMPIEGGMIEIWHNHYWLEYSRLMADSLPALKFVEFSEGMVEQVRAMEMVH